MKKMLTAMVIAMGMMATTGMLPATSAAAGTAMPDKEITIDGKKPARFNHATHLGLGVSCGQCHHDAGHQPLAEAAISAMPDAGKLSCVNCHNSDFANAKLQTKKDIFHARCKECHKQGVGDKKGPTSCKACHAGKPQKAIEGC